MSKKDPLPAFTPTFRWVVDATADSDLALVYGLVWHYAQMQHGYCHASCSRMAADLHWSRQRLVRHLGVLRRQGFILCDNPDEQGATRHYVPLSEDEWWAARGRTAETEVDAPNPPTAPVPPPSPEPVSSQGMLPPPKPVVLPDTPVASRDVSTQRDTPVVPHDLVAERDTTCHDAHTTPVAPRGDTCHTARITPVTPRDTNERFQESLKRDSRRRVSENPAPAGAAGDPPRRAGVRLVSRLLCWRPPKVLHERIEASVAPGATAEDLRPYYEAWCARGFNPRNLAWLFEWYVEGRVPAAGPPARPGGAARSPAAADTPEAFARWARYEEAIRKGEDPDEAKRRLDL